MVLEHAPASKSQQCSHSDISDRLHITWSVSQPCCWGRWGLASPACPLSPDRSRTTHRVGPWHGALGRRAIVGVRAIVVPAQVGGGGNSKYLDECGARGSMVGYRRRCFPGLTCNWLTPSCKIRGFGYIAIRFTVGRIIILWASF